MSFARAFACFTAIIIFMPLWWSVSGGDDDGGSKTNSSVHAALIECAKPQHGWNKTRKSWWPIWCFIYRYEKKEEYVAYLIAIYVSECIFIISFHCICYLLLCFYVFWLLLIAVVTHADCSLWIYCYHTTFSRCLQIF